MLAAYASGGIVADAAAAGGVCRDTFYEWLNTDPDFAMRASLAIEDAADNLESEAVRRGRDGVVKPLVSGGKLVRDDEGEPILLHEYSDTLLIFLLKARRPARFRERFDATLTVDTGLPVSDKPADETHSRLLDNIRALRDQPAIEATARDHAV